MPIVNGKIPAIRDYLLTLWSLTAITGLVLITDYREFFNENQVQLISDFGMTIFITFPWWFWRSFKGVMYYRQHASLQSLHIASLVLTNIFTYACIGYVFRAIFA